MIDLRHSLVIEATDDPSFFSFYSTELEGFTGVGTSVEDCLYRAKWGMLEHVSVLEQQGLPIPPPNPNPQVVIQNADRLSAA
jgi:predicted RNase H-like HicB family nuclease